MQPPRITPAPEGMAVCPRHGLRYDPRLSTGCIRCRRTSDEAARPWMAPLAMGLTLVGVAALAIPLRGAILAYLAAPPASSSAPARQAPAEHQRCVEAGAGALATAAGDCATACAAGWGPSCRRLAGLCSPAAVVARDDEACAPGALALLAQACKAHDGVACALQADARRGQVLARACAGGIGRACTDLAPLCAPERGSLVDGAPTTGWAFFADPALREACSGGPRKLYERGCNQGDWAACERPEAGIQTPPARMRTLLEEACDGADAPACRKLAAMVGHDEPGLSGALIAYANELDSCAGAGGAGCEGVRRWRERVSTERPRAIKQSAVGSEQGCEQGHIVSCWVAAEAYATGEGVARDERRAASLNERARALLRTQCNDQDGGACASPDTLRTLEACDRGDGAACLDAVRIAGASAGVEVLQRRALRLLDAGCEARQGDACWRLAALAQRGALPGGDEALLALLRKGCDARHGLSCHDLGLRLADGRGVAKDRPASERNLRRAADLLDPSCQAGDDAACAALAGLYAEGRGVARDETRAASYRARAAGAAPPAGSAPRPL